MTETETEKFIKQLKQLGMTPEEQIIDEIEELYGEEIAADWLESVSV